MFEERPQHYTLQSTPSVREIRAVFDADTIQVYQAFSKDIAYSAIENGRFVSPPFRMTRMTWIKPSFLWMMYRSGWGLKDAGQNRILAINITRQGFEWALRHSSLSHDAKNEQEVWRTRVGSSPVRIQWDPERDLQLRALPYRAIQIGLSGEAVRLYVNEWVCRIADITHMTHEIHDLVEAQRFEEARTRLPIERSYPLPAELLEHIGAS